MASPLIYRKRLINAINDPGHHIVYLYGPAGFGKTTLAEHWMDSQSLPTVWMDGYSTSNPNALFQDFMRATCEQLPHLKSKLTSLFNLKTLTVANVIELIEILEEDKTPFNVVINNAEDIRKAHNELSLTMVRLMPKHIKLIMVTSTSPRSEFIKEAGINRFAVVGPEELRFTDEEIKLIAQDAIPEINDEDIKQIQELTEGWPAGTEIVISLLRGNAEFRDQLSNLRLKGKSYFAVEANRVLAKLEEKPHQLLLQLSLLRTITPEIAYEITKDVDVVRQLTLLSQDSIVLSQIEQTPPAFKIHPIFRDALIDELRRQDSFSDTLESVVANLLKHGEIRQATSILVEIGEVLRLSDLLKDEDLLEAIGTSIQDSISRSAVDELRDWVTVSKHLPVVGNLGKATIMFYVEFLSGNFAAAESQIQILNSEVSNTAKMNVKLAESWKPDVLVLKSMLAYAEGRLEENWNLAIQAFELKQKKPAQQSRHQITYLQLALWAAIISDDYERVSKISTVLDGLSGVDQGAQRNSMIMAMRCLIAAHEGRLVETQNYLITPISALSHTKVRGFFGPFGSRLAEAILVGEAGNLRQSISLLDENAKESLAAANYPMAIASLGRKGYLESILNNSESGLASIDAARKIIQEKALPQEVNSIVDMWEIRIRHMMFDPERVQQLLKRCKPSYFVRSFQAAANISIENYDQVRNIISTFDRKIPRQAITYHLFQAYTLKASPAAQLKEIAKAVDIGAKHGYFHHFLTQRSDIMQQYISLASESPTAFNERLARAAGEELNKMMIAKSESGDALTRREADILRHLATGLPLKDIAANLNISKNTIKTHLRNLYRKLGAEDRKDAVEKGKKLLKV